MEKYHGFTCFMFCVDSINFLKQSIFITTHVQSLHLSGFLSWGGGGRGVPPEAVSHPSDTFVPPKIWFENNIKISITKEIYITIDFAPEKILGRQPALGSQII